MDLSAYLRMDANILLGIVNEKLRLECDNLEELLSMYNMGRSELSHKLEEIGYHYDPLTNQFKAT